MKKALLEVQTEAFIYGSMLRSILLVANEKNTEILKLPCPSYYPQQLLGSFSLAISNITLKCLSIQTITQ